jgi:hypothetical protein
MLYHHDNRDYNVAASEAATRARGILEGIINKGAANAGRVLEKVMTEVPTDHIVKGDQITFHAVPLNPDDPRSRFAVQAEFEDKPRFSLHNHAVAQVRERLHIPAAYSDYLLGESEWGAVKLARDMQEIARHENARYLTREIKGEIRGWLSDQFRRLDSRPLLEAFATSAQEAGLIPIEGYALDTKIAFKAILPQIFEPVPNEVMAFGLKWGNSDYGDGMHNVHAFVMRLWCTNYAIAEDALAQRHLGARLPDDLRLSAQTYQLDTDANASLMKDIVKGLLSPAKVNAFLEAVKESNDKDINPKNAFEVIKKRVQKNEAEKIINAFESPDTHNMPEGKTAWRLSNAISWIAGNLDDKNRALDLMRLAGEVARLPGKEKAS